MTTALSLRSFSMPFDALVLVAMLPPVELPDFELLAMVEPGTGILLPPSPCSRVPLPSEIMGSDGFRNSAFKAAQEDRHPP